ncbi:MAG: SAF domain-containing protein [Myxococcales bacterium]|nr:SAF domain-containing protein [Myxococcales bacterium]
MMARTAMSGFLLGVVAGALAGTLLSVVMVQAARARTTAEFAPTPVLATSRDIPAGTTLTDADLVESTFPAPLVTPSCATPATRSSFVGKPVRWRVNAGSVLRDTDLIQADPECATRVARSLERLDGGSPETRVLGTALLQRHGGAR